MRQLIVDWLVGVTERDSSQFLHIPDNDLFEMFFSTFHEKYYKHVKEAITSKRITEEFGNALAKSIKEGRYF